MSRVFRDLSFLALPIDPPHSPPPTHPPMRENSQWRDEWIGNDYISTRGVGLRGVTTIGLLHSLPLIHPPIQCCRQCKRSNTYRRLIMNNYTSY